MTETVVKPKITRLPLRNGHYIDVKRRLNTGEKQDLFAVMAPHVTPGEKVQFNSKAALNAKVLAYLVGWSLTDDGEPIPMGPESIAFPESRRLASLRSLEHDVFMDIRDAIEAHEDAVEKEMAALKNAPAGETGSPATSPSVAP